MKFTHSMAFLGNVKNKLYRVIIYLKIHNHQIKIKEYGYKLNIMYYDCTSNNY